MSKRNKLLKFSEVLSFPNVLENFDGSNPKLVRGLDNEVDFSGKWSAEFFGNDNPLILELACGRGEYTLGLSKIYPEKNFIGVDIKGARIWQGAKIALEEKASNVGFVRTRIEQIEHFFGQNEVSEIWITFPDPFLKEKKSNRRLTSIPFLKRFQKILKPGGIINLKTDSDELYEFTMEVLESTPELTTVLYVDEDIYAKSDLKPELLIKTYYEGMHLAKGKKIKYVQFALK